MSHDFETSILADGVKFIIGCGWFELVEAVFLEFLAVVGGSGWFVAFLGVVGLLSEVEVDGVVGLQSGVAVVAVSDVEVLHPEGSSRVLEAVLTGLRSAVERRHIINHYSIHSTIQIDRIGAGSELADLRLDVARELGLPPVAVGQQFLLAVEELLVVDGGVLVVGSLHDGVHWAGLLAVPAVDALRHVDVVSRGPAGTVRPRLALNRNGVGRAGSRAQFASDASWLLARYLSSPVG
jgi:hypothetical protein